MPAILDFDFSRPASYDPTDMVGVACVRSLASSAHPGTYVGQDGLIKLAPHNLLTYSEQLDNAAWTKNRASISANSSAAFDGQMTADKLIEDGTSGQHFASEAFTFSAVEYTAFAFFKAGERSVAVISQASFRANFNLATQTVTDTAGSPTSTSIKSYGNGWYRCSMTFTAAAGASTIVFGMSNATTGFSYAGDATSGIYLGGAQLNLGPIPLDYTKTTTAANGGTRIAWGPREPYQNLLLQTTWPDAGANPTGWTVGSGSNSNTNSKWGTAAQARTFTTSASRSYLTQAFTLVSNTTYSIGIRVEEVSGTITLVNVLTAISLPAGCTVTGYQVNGVTFSDSTQALAGTTVSMTLAGTYTGGAITIRVGNGVNSNTTATVKLSRPNLNIGAQAYNWYPTTTTAVYVTPFDLVNNWECHGAMSEGARTNLFLWSEDLSNTWSRSNMLAFGAGSVVNAAVAPDGITTADLLVPTVASSAHATSQAATVTAASYSVSIFVKDAGYSKVAIREGGVTGAYVCFDLSSASVITSSSATGIIRPVGNGWYRIAIVYTGTDAVHTFVVHVMDNSYASGAPNSYAWAGDGTSGIYLWGAQLEASPYPTSYIPKTTAAVTRNADAISYTLSGAHATALSSQGTAVVEYRVNKTPVGGDLDGYAVSIDDGTSNERHWIGTSATDAGVYATTRDGGVNQAVIVAASRVSPGVKYTSSYAWNTNACLHAANGSTGTKDTAATMPAVTTIGFGAASSGGLNLFGTVKRVTIFSTALTDTQVTHASKPVEPTAHWRTYDGTHRTASDTDKTVSCDIETDVDLDTAGEDGVQRVEFYVSVNGVLSSIATQTARSERTHNSTPAGANGFTTISGYGITVDCSALDGGTITVDATVFSNLGAVSYLPTLTIYNDTDGVDRRPSSSIVYYDYDLGDDATGTGTFANPVKNPRAAMNLLSGDVGGATIRAKGRTVGMTPSASYSASGWSTSGKWALTFEAVGTDKTWQRLTPGTFSDPQDYILGTSGAAQVRMRFKDFEFKGPGPTLYVNGPNAQIDEVNCLHYSHNWDGVRLTPHVDDDEYGSGGVSIALNGASTGLIFSWGGRWRAVGRGPGAYSGLFNFSIGPFLGVAIGTANTYGSNPCYTNGEIFGVRYVAGELAGLIQTNPNFTQLAGANVTVSVQASGPHTGKMRVEATNATPNDFGTAAGQLVGSTRWGVTVGSATSGANNGTFAALEGGLNGSGWPYCILDNASAVGEVGSAGFNMDTGALDDGARYIDDVHTDILQIEAPHVGAMFAHIRGFDCHNTRTWVGSGYALTRCVFKNLTDGDSEGAFDFGSGASILLDCLFLHLSVASSASSFTGSFTGTNFVDCVWGSGTNIPTVGTFIHSNHFVTGSSPGTSPSTGVWFASDETLAPFSYAPTIGNMGTASGLQDAPPFWYHTGAVAPSRGAWKNVATGNWSTAPTGGGSTVGIPYLGLGVRVGFL